ncbi:MAG: hypothetical protein ACRD04_05680 [Terriglobales bacterium]
MARGDKGTYNQQEQQAFSQAAQAAQQGATNQNAAFGAAYPGYLTELANPGYSPGEQQSMTQAELGSLAGAFGAARAREQGAAARTGNTAGMNATEEELARQQGQQQAQAMGSLAQAFGNAGIAGTQNALRGLGSLYGQSTSAANAGMGGESRDVASQGQVASKPGFWSSVLSGGLRAARG